MARLSQEQVLKLIKTPKNGSAILIAKKQEERLIMHTTTVQEQGQLNQAFKSWLLWAKSLLPKDKWDKFEKLILLPLPTNQIVESIYKELAKVFEAQNSQKRAQLTDKSLQTDAEDYLERTGLSSFMATYGWSAIKTGINGFVVVDLPSVQTTLRPEPKTYFLPLDRVHDVEIRAVDQKLEYIAFRIDGNKMVIVDDEFYRVYTKDKNTSTYTFDAEFTHSWYNELGELVDGLGYVPVASIFPNSTGAANCIDKRGPISSVLSNLDWYLFKEVSHRYLSLYADYPIIVTYKEVCTYKDHEGNMCDGGKIPCDYEEGGIQKTRWTDCPDCEGRKTVGPGSFWTIDPPRDKNDVDLMNEPVKIVEVSNDKLEFGLDSLKRMEDKIYLNTVGIDVDQNTDQAKNEKQIMSGFESRQSVLEDLKLTLEATEEFIWDTTFIMRYGREYYTGSVINYGNKFYLQTVEEINERYAAAKTAGKPMYELAGIRDLANKTQNRHNPDAMTRVEILEQLEPWPDLSLTQVQSMGLANSDLITYFVKLNFNSYISRFERENMDIVEFGSKASLKNKIEAINNKLIEYAKEQIEVASAYTQPVEPNPGNSTFGR